MNKRHKSRFCFSLLLIVIIFSFGSCSERSRKPFYEADISGIYLDSPKIKRYEKALFGMNPHILAEEIENHRDSFAIFLENTIDESSIQRLHDFITDPQIVDLYLGSREVWGEMEFLTKDLHKALTYFHYHFPYLALPEFYTYIGGVDYITPVKHFDDYIIIGIDSYLGSNYETYDRIGIPKYISRWMQPENLVVDIMLAMADTRLSKLDLPNETLLDHMIFHGKRQFFVDCMLPRTHDSLKISYTGAHLEWINRFESYAFMYKLDNNLLYSTDHRTINNFINKAPFTSRFSNESAPRTGVWLGWQIVREYMRRHPDVGLQELLAESDSRKILSGARYRPR